MSTKSLFLGIAVPKVFSETKSAALPRARGQVVLPRSKTTPVSRSVSGSNLVPFVSATVIVALAVMLGFHLFMVNAYSGKGFELKRTQAAISELTQQQKALTVRQAELGSFLKVSDLATSLGLVPVTDEEYITSNHLTQR